MILYIHVFITLSSIFFFTKTTNQNVIHVYVE